MLQRICKAGISASIRPADPRDDAPETPHDVPAAFTAGAIIGVAVDWLQRDCPQKPSEMATLVWPLLSALYDTQVQPPS
jgi:hypothetical protein